MAGRLYQVRPGFGFLGFAGTAHAPGNTAILASSEWELQFKPVVAASVPANGSTVRFVNRTNNECLDVAGGRDLITWPCHGGWNQRFTWQDGRLMQNGQCLDVTGSQRARSTQVILWPCHGGANQRWTIDADGRIASQLSGVQWCLDVHREHGDAVKTWECHATSTDQRFAFERL